MSIGFLAGKHDWPKSRQNNQRQEIQRLRQALQEIEVFNIDWSKDLDANVERIKSIAIDALADKNDE